MRSRPLIVVLLLACRHAAQAQSAPEPTPPPGALGMPSADGGAPDAQSLSALGAAAVRELGAGAARRKQAAALLRSYIQAAELPHERAWAEAELEELGVDRERWAEPARRIGLLLPLSGRLRPVGERLLQGALLAADEVILEIGDTRSDPQRAAEEADRLGDAYALVGPADREELQVLRDRPRQAPLMPIVAGETLPSTAERAGALWSAARRTAPAATRVAFMAPEGAAGDDMVAALRQAGADLVAEVRYPKAGRQFSQAVGRVVAASPDAVFVGDTAGKLALIAPALAAAGLWPLPDGPPRGAEGRGVLLLATGEGATSELTRQAGRYLQGALLAPGFFPDPEDETIGPFVTRFTEEYGRPPGPWEAFAYQAVRAVADARTPSHLPAWRSSWPLVYRVQDHRVRVLR